MRPPPIDASLSSLTASVGQRHGTCRAAHAGTRVHNHKNWYRRQVVPTGGLACGHATCIPHVHCTQDMPTKATVIGLTAYAYVQHLVRICNPVIPPPA